MKYLYLMVLLPLLMSGCTDPEVAAQKKLQAIHDGWAKYREELDPGDRVELYTGLLSSAQKIPQDYPDTRVGRALAAGQTADGVSISAIERELNRLQERAGCYENPTADCLLAFASRGTQEMGANAAIGAPQRAMVLVCEDGFARADAELEPIRINRPAYAEALVQLALQAAQCKPSEIKPAIVAYTRAEPATGSARVSKFMAILQTDPLQVAWSDMIALVDQEVAASGLSPGDVAGIDLTLAVKLARLGETDAALARFNRVAQNFNVDVRTRIDMASALLASGQAGEALTVGGPQANNDFVIAVIHYSARAVAEQLSLLRRGGAVSVDVPRDGDLDVLFAPVERDQAASARSAAAAIEQTLDEFMVPQGGQGKWLGTAGAETSYGMLGLIHQKLGDGEMAQALVAKGEKAREALSRPGSYKADSRNDLAQFQILVALANGDTDTAIRLYPRLQSANYLQFAIMNGLAKQGNAEGALTFAAQANAAGPNTSQFLMERLGKYGHVREAEKVLVAAQSQLNASTFANLAWTLVERAAQAGKLDDAEAIANKYNLLAAPVRQLRLAELKAEAAIAADQRSKAESALREMHALGDSLDEASGGNATNFYAQGAATHAFAAGYTELGIELYQAASRKDQRPLLGAFSENTRKSDFPRLLMIAHDNLRGEELGYVIDSAIRRLRVSGS